MEVAAAFIGLLPGVWTFLMHTVAASNDMDEIYKDLNQAIAMLCARRDDLQNAIQRHKVKMSRTYDQWSYSVSSTEQEVKKLLDKYDSQSQRSRTFCVMARSNFTNDMKKMIRKLNRLWEESNQFGRILVDQQPEPVIEMITPTIEKFSTLREPLKVTLDLLKNDKVKGIAISGMMGTGKTVIMKNLKNHEEVAKTFDMVMWIKVSTEDTEENLSMRHLQKVVAKRLKVDTAGTNHFDDIAQRISNELTGKRYLLLLDDVKEDLHIHQIGIPPSDNGSKIVLTTRLRHICLPKVDQVVKVTYLSPRESWRMFQDVVNRPDLKDDRRVEALARQIVNECGGHPLLIKIIASVFKMKDDVELWSEGFNSLKRFSTKEHHGLMELNNVIKFCYYDLDDTQRKCFLYGALYPEESHIYKDYLLECWEAEDLLGNGDARKATSNGSHVLDYLKTKSLLEDDKSRKYVTMHKCIRQVALYISSDDPKCKLLVKTKTLEMPLHAKCWSKKNWISLVKNQVDELPDYPNCGLLSTLFLQENLDLKSIPAFFFEHMINLKVLDLCRTGITSLPSLSKVISLKVLYLCYCENLEELHSSLEKLEHLEVLDIRGCGFNNIPCYIGNMKGLRRFRVSITKCGSENDAEEVRLNYDVISRLSKLEELVIDVKSPRHQSNKVVGNIIKSVTTLEKLASLQFQFSNEIVDVIQVVLPTLRIHVPEADILHTFIEKNRLWRKRPSFHFFIGCQDSNYPLSLIDHGCERYVKYCNGEGSSHPIFEVLRNVDAFELVNHKDIKQLSDLGTTSMGKVQDCLIESCGELETAVDSTILPNLKHLYMKNLPKLHSIWNDRVERAELTKPKLKTLVLSKCDLLKIVFLVVIQQLEEIEYLKIEDCSGIVELVEKSQTTRNLDLLPKLKKLILLDMPKLKSICADKVSRWPALKKLKIHNCPALHKLPFNKDDAEKMELIQAEQQWWDTLQWSNNEVKEKLQQFCDFRYFSNKRRREEKVEGG